MMKPSTLAILFAASFAACSGDAAPEAAPAPAPAPEAAPPAPAEVGFTYTSLGDDNCTWGEPNLEDGPVLVTGDCKGHGGYDIRISSHDHGAELNLTRGGKELGLQYNPPGWMATVTDGKVEWRHRGDTPHALIFRVNWADPDGESTGLTTLVVARIDGDSACEIGRTSSNDEARTIADDESKGCG